MNKYPICVSWLSMIVGTATSLLFFNRHMWYLHHPSFLTRTNTVTSAEQQRGGCAWLFDFFSGYHYYNHKSYFCFLKGAKMFSHWLDQPEKEVAEEEKQVPRSPIISTDGTHFTDVCDKIGDTEQMAPKPTVIKVGVVSWRFLVRSEVAERSDRAPLSTEGRSHIYTSVSEKTGRQLLFKEFINLCTESSERQAGVTSRCLWLNFYTVCPPYELFRRRWFCENSLLLHDTLL